MISRGWSNHGQRLRRTRSAAVPRLGLSERPAAKSATLEVRRSPSRQEQHLIAVADRQMSEPGPVGSAHNPYAVGPQGHRDQLAVGAIRQPRGPIKGCSSTIAQQPAIDRAALISGGDLVADQLRVLD